MSEITAAALDIAGFALAQAVTRLCVMKNGAQLAPLSIVRDESGTLHLKEYDGMAQAAAVEQARGDYAINAATSDAWAFAREGTYCAVSDDSEHDVIAVDFWSKGMPYVASLMQRFRRAGASVRFHLDGVPSIVDNGTPLDADEGALMVDRVRQGVGEHPEAEKLWRWWE